MRSRLPSRPDQPSSELSTSGPHVVVDRAAEVDDFIQWFDETSARVYGVVLAVVADEHQAATLTRQVYVDLWHDPTHGVGVSIARVVALAHQRAVAHVRPTLMAHEPRTCPGPNCVWVSAGTYPGRVRVVDLALDSLPVMHRRALEMAYFCGHSSSEVSALLDVSPPVAARLVRSALIRLQSFAGDVDGV